MLLLWKLNMSLKMICIRIERDMQHLRCIELKVSKNISDCERRKRNVI